MYHGYVELLLRLPRNSNQDLLDGIHLLPTDGTTDPLRLHRRAYEESRLHDLLQVLADPGIVVETNGLIHGCEIQIRVGDHGPEKEAILQDPPDPLQGPRRVAVEVEVPNEGDVDALPPAVQSLRDLVEVGQDPQHLKVFLDEIIATTTVLSIAILPRYKKG